MSDEERPRQTLDLGEDEKLGLRAYHKILNERPRSPLGVDPGLQGLCLRVTGSFEGKDSWANIAGNFDGQGISLGVLQQCLGQGSLQPLLKKMFEKYSGVAWKALGRDNAQELEALMTKSLKEQIAWGDSISLLPKKYRIEVGWVLGLKALARTNEYIGIQIEAASGIFQKALTICEQWGLQSVRAIVWAFDTVTQQGGIGSKHLSRIRQFLEVKKQKLGRELTEQERMTAITEGRTSFSNPQWQADVMSRRMAIIRGYSAPFEWRGVPHNGLVHGTHRMIDQEFGVNDEPWRKSQARTWEGPASSICPHCGKSIMGGIQEKAVKLLKKDKTPSKDTVRSSKVPPKGIKAFYKKTR